VFVFSLEKIKKHKIWWKIIKKKHFGKIKGNKIFLSVFEVLYLYENRVSKKQFKKVEKLMNKYLEKYLIFKDLLKKGFVIKSALKYGFDFRVYTKEDFKKEGHSLYLVKVLKENEQLNSKSLISLFRISHTVRKRAIFAFIDEEGDIIYYESKWLRI
jgi:tRNA-intron endonuclease